MIHRQNPKLFFVGLLLCLCWQWASAQGTITGRVQDEDSQPIAYANVALLTLGNEELVQGSITDEVGAFQLAGVAKGQYLLLTSFVGYADQRDTIDVQQQVISLGIIVLRPSSETLSEVVVRANRPIVERKGDKLIFNVQSSPLKLGYDGMEVLQHTPNIWLDGGGAILMRNEAATVMINGRMTNLSGEQLASYLRALRSEDIKSIEVQTSISANVNAESSGGIINITLNKKPIGISGNLKSYAMYRGEDYYRLYGGGDFNYGLEKWNVYGAYNYTLDFSSSAMDSDITYNNSSNILSTNRFSLDTLQRHNYKLGFVIEPHKKHIIGAEVFGSFAGHQRDNDSDVRMRNEGNLLDRGTTLFKDNTDRQLFNATTNYSWQLDTLGSSLKVFVDYAQQDYDRNNDAISFYQIGLYEDNTERNQTDSKTEIFSLQSDLTKQFGSSLKWESGIKYTYTDRTNALRSELFSDNVWKNIEDRTTAFVYQEQILAAYSSVGFSFREKNFVKLGLRVENTDLERIDLIESIPPVLQNYTDWFPSLYYSRDLHTKHSLFVSYSRRMRRPSFNLLNNNIRKINDFRFELGNPDLQPEYVNKWEVGYNGSKQSIIAYYNRTNEVINGIYFLEGDVAFYKKFNAGAQVQFGLDYNRFGNLYKWWYLKISGGLYHRKFIDEEG
ncbi:MAG: TonB-dependent receptor, partial [Bacteroidota bacterium]